MRPIKFRVWDKEFNRMKITGMGIYNGELTCDDSCIIMQFSGLKDKNGKEIYEGDIVRQKKNAGAMFKVIWDTQDAQWWVDPVDKQQGGDVDPLWRWAKVTQVIGNIYENPNPT